MGPRVKMGANWNGVEGGGAKRSKAGLTGEELSKSEIRGAGPKLKGRVGLGANRAMNSSKRRAQL